LGTYSHSDPNIRVIWIGVRISPQGKPHQPRNSEPSAASAFALFPHAAQEICGLLEHLVITKADQTE